MGILTRLFEPQGSATQESLIQTLMNGGAFGGSHSGISVTPESAMKCAAVYACVKVISESVGQLPLILYKRTNKAGREGKERATTHRLYPMLHLRPNKGMTSLHFREMLTAHTALRGNAFAYINRVAGGQVYELLPLHPDSVEVKRDEKTWEVSYKVKMRGGETQTFSTENILHVMGMTLNGYAGVTPLTYARETIGLSLATEKHGARLFANGARPSGVLKHPKTLSQPAYERLKGSLATEFSGDNAHMAMLLEEGMEWTTLTMTSEDAQFLQTRQFQIPEIARFYRMPLHKIQEMTRATFSNIEQQALEFVTDCLMPWLVRWEQTLNTSLLNEKEQQEYYFEFNVDGLLRGDIKSRYEAHSRGILAGFINRNEARAKENLDAVEGLDEFLTPTNMALAGTEAANEKLVSNRE